jgi:hypothetical protein
MADRGDDRPGEAVPATGERAPFAAAADEELSVRRSGVFVGEAAGDSGAA